MVFRIFLCAIIIPWQLNAQGVDSLLSKKQKVEHLDEYIILKATHSAGVEKFALLTSDKDIRLSPNISSHFGLSFAYRFIYFGVGFAPKFLPGNEDDTQKGKTRSGGFFMSTGLKRWYGELYYARTKGYYLENTSDYDPTWSSGDPYIQFPELVFTQYQGIVTYKFNPEFSVSAVTFQSERQLKSAGSFIPQFRCRYYINDDRTMLTATNSSQKGRNLELLIGAGYHYTLVAKERFYISLGLTPGAGYVFSRIETRYANQTISGNQSNAVFRLDGRAGAGYNTRRFFAGVYVNASAAAYNQQRSSVVTENDAASFQLFIGYRLAAPQWLRKPVHKIEQKLQFK